MVGPLSLENIVARFVELTSLAPTQFGEVVSFPTLLDKEDIVGVVSLEDEASAQTAEAPAGSKTLISLRSKPTPLYSSATFADLRDSLTQYIGE